MTGIDLVDAEEVFAASTDLTVGIEEEFQILDPQSLDLVSEYPLLQRAAEQDEQLRDSVCGELIASEIEIISGRGRDLEDALARQREQRRRLFALVAAHELGLGATGTHPWADYRQQRIIDTEHYRRVEQGLKYVAWRNNTFSLHLHVGVHGIERAVRVCDRLRPVLPSLLAVSANSPYVDGRDSGLHSARSQIFTRNFPRCGIPEPFGSWSAYRDYVELLWRTGSIVEFTQVWWSVRPHVAFGTVEVRICDAQLSAEESDALIALIFACVAQAMRDEDEGLPFDDPPGRLIEENFWRAIRYGLDGHMIDLDGGYERPPGETLADLEAWTGPTRAELGIELAFPARNGAQRQRELIERGASMEEVFQAAVEETMKSYGQEVKR